MGLLGLLEGLESSLNRSCLLVLEGGLPSLLVSLLPFGGLEVLHLISNIIKLIRDLIHGGVGDVDTGLVLVDVSLEGLTEILPLSNESLSSLGSEEFLVELLEGSDLCGLTPSLEGRTEVSDDLGVLDLLSDKVDIFGFSFDFSLTLLGDLNLEKVGLLLPLLWDIRDLDLFLKSSLKIFHLELELLSWSGFLEGLCSSLHTSELFVGESSTVGPYHKPWPTWSWRETRTHLRHQ